MIKTDEYKVGKVWFCESCGAVLLYKNEQCGYCGYKLGRSKSKSKEVKQKWG
jgi:ribosomal protein L40E